MNDESYTAVDASGRGDGDVRSRAVPSASRHNPSASAFKGFTAVITIMLVLHEVMT